MKRTNGNANKISVADRPFHDWYRFVLSFPPHLVRDYLGNFELETGKCVFDPFAGTGTTIVEAKLLGFVGLGTEINPMAQFAGSVKSTWSANGRDLLLEAERIASLAETQIKRSRKLRELSEEQSSLLLTNSICPIPLHKSLVLRDVIMASGQHGFVDYAKLALAKTLVFSASNLHFGPEVGVRGRKIDTDVVASWLENMRLIARDLASVEGNRHLNSNIYLSDARTLIGCLQPQSIDAVFTSPPYPNEKDYTRTTRLESVLLGFVSSKEHLRQLKQGLLRSNTRNIYKDDTDDKWVSSNEKIQRIAGEIEQIRLGRGSASGFEKQYHKVVKQYFGGMARHLSELRPYLRPGAHLGYVVGDQASFYQVMIRTGEILAEIAESLGYEVLRIDLFRTRLATATKQQMREEVVILRWNGNI
ncbi:MAG: DNA methyltransferase [Geobacter sp.]|nr:MAG: DNA methyltransferase [Geobacter sp.]